MKKIALINQRYGLEVNGGSEYYTRLIAEKLSKMYEVDVLTSKALSYKDWKNFYKEDIEKINGVTVRRFEVKYPRDIKKMNFYLKLIKKLRINTLFLCEQWVKAQGPYVPELIQYLKENRDNYDAFIFVTYLYYTTVMGLPEVRDKAVFIPTAHDEPYMDFKTHKRLFKMPKAIVYLTSEEKKLVEDLNNNNFITSIVAGVGIDIPDNVDNESFRKKYNIDTAYIVYAGRIDESKGCHEMFDMFIDYYEKHENIQLILMGKSMMDIPKHKAIRYIGFVSDKDKFDGLSGAKALWMPSHFESLSIAVLEAMSLSIPVLVSGRCEVLKGHCDKSEGGFYYNDTKELFDMLDVLIYDESTNARMGKNARKYVMDNYTWDKIMEELVNLIDNIRID